MTQRIRVFVLTTGAIVGVLGLLLLRVFDPATSGVFPPCPVHYLTGLYCPGCGSLRAIHALLRGNMAEAWAMNPLTIVLLPFLAYGLLSELSRVLRGRGLPQPVLPAPVIYALFVVVVSFGFVRNLPVHPFSLLAPGAMLHL